MAEQDYNQSPPTPAKDLAYQTPMQPQRPLPADQNPVDLDDISKSSAQRFDLESSASPQVSISVSSPVMVFADQPQPSSQQPQRFDTNATAAAASAPNGREDEFPEDLNPPENFAMVSPYIYRSGMPKKRNFEFLKRLKLKSILTLILEEYPKQNQKFLDANGIRLFQFGVAGNKEPFADIPEDIMSEALLTLLDTRNHPILIHCNKGKHRTGCLVGCLRKIQEWSYTSIFDEYRVYSAPKSRSMDQQYIELFNVGPVVQAVDKEVLPDWPTIQNLKYKN